jgi:putative ABC transport system permease protein
VNSIIRGIRNAFRNSIRTLSVVIILALTIGLALAMSIARGAVDTKIASVKSSIGNTVSISPAGARGFEGGGEPLTEAELSKVSGINHVTKLSEVLSDRLTTSETSLQSAVDAGSLGRRFSGNSGQSFAPPADFAVGQSSGSSSAATVSFTPPVTVLGTTTPTDLSSSQGGGTFTLKSGSAFSADSSENIAMIGSSLATKNNLSVGSTFTAYNNTTFTVVAIFDAGNTFSNNQVIMPLKTVQTLSDQAGQVSSATLTVDSLTNTDSVVSAAKKALSTTADVTSSVEEAKTTVEPLENIRKVSALSLAGAVGAGAVIILLTMIMIVRERRREIGVLKSIGASNFVIVKQFMVEALTFTILSAVVGLGIGIIGGQPLTKMLVTNSTSSTQQQAGPGQAPGGFNRATRGIRSNLTNIKTSVGFETLGYGLGAAIFIALFGAAASALLIAKVRPAEVMRTE